MLQLEVCYCHWVGELRFIWRLAEIQVYLLTFVQMTRTRFFRSERYPGLVRFQLSGGSILATIWPEDWHERWANTSRLRTAERTKPQKSPRKSHMHTHLRQIAQLRLLDRINRKPRKKIQNGVRNKFSIEHYERQTKGPQPLNRSIK